MASADLTALLARVEAAEGPDRELDLALSIALEFPAHRPMTMDDRWAATGIEGKHTLDGNGWFNAPFFTASLDAALALVARTLGAIMWSIGNTGDDGGDAAFEADLYAKSGQPDWEVHTYGPSPPLALIAALLRALIAEAETQDAEAAAAMRGTA